MSHTEELGELKEESIDAYFEHEQEEFTPWLEENIDKIETIVDLSLDDIEREASVGRFQADLCAEAQETGQTVIIENQFDRTDHKHLGQSIVYGAGTEAEVVVWIAENFTEEHISAFRWLNNHTDDEVNLFAVEVTLHRIDDSPYAVEFTPVERPDTWSSRIQDETMSDTDQFYLNFWSAFREYAEKQGLQEFTGRSPRPAASYHISVGYSDVYLRPTARHSRGELAAMVRFTHDDMTFAGIDQHEFETAMADAVEDLDTAHFDQSVTSSLEWDAAPEGETYDHIKLTRPMDTGDQEGNQAAYHQWLTEASRLFRHALDETLD